MHSIVLNRFGAAALALAAACCFTGCNDSRTTKGHSENQRMVAEAWIPEPTRQSLLKHAGNAEIKSVSTATRPDGSIVYLATLERGDDYSLLTVDSAGDVVSERPIQPPALAIRRSEGTLRSVQFADLPEPTRKTVLSRVKVEQIRRIEQSQVKDRTVYDVVADHDGAVMRLCVDAEGKVITEEKMAELTQADRVAIANIPDRPRTVILERTRGSAIRDIHTDTVDGKVVYTVVVDRNEYLNDFIIDLDGHLLTRMRVENRLAVGDVPAAPRTTLVQMADTGTIRMVERATDEGRDLYTAVVDKGVRTSRITVDRLGYLVSRRKAVKIMDLNELSNPARAAIKEHAHEREIESIEQQNDSGRTFYEVRLTGEELTTVRVTETGDVVKQ